MGLFQLEPGQWQFKPLQVSTVSASVISSVGIGEHVGSVVKMEPLSVKEIEERIAQRLEARKKKDFAKADEIRKSLAADGIIVEDKPTAPAAGNADQPELPYGLHAVREALRAGTRPLQRLLVLREDRQFADLVQQARSQHIPVHIEPPAAFDRLVPDQRHQGVIAFIAAKAYCSTDEILEHARRP